MHTIRTIFLLIVVWATPVLAHVNYPNFDDNPTFSKSERKKTRPYLMPLDHPIKPILDLLCTSSRITLNAKTLTASGFQIHSMQPRSFIVVARHPLMPGYIFKLYLDNELRQKKGKPGWKWFILRCKGAKKVAKSIKKRDLYCLTVPKKWLYPLPWEPALPETPEYNRKHTILIAEEMPLLPGGENLQLWKTAINRNHLLQIYLLLKDASSVRCRPDNVHWMADGRLAIIDTEYPDKRPDLGTIRTFLNDEMVDFWDTLPEIL